MMGPMGFGFGSLSFIFMLLFGIAIIALAVWLVSRLFPRATDNPSSRSTAWRSDPSESPLEILKQRYARGEISKPEYEEMHRDLEECLNP